MKKAFLFLATLLCMFSCFNDAESEMWGESSDGKVTTRAGYRGVSGNLYLTNSLETATRLTWEITSIDFIGEDIVSSIQEDYIHTDFSGATNAISGGTFENEIIGSSYLLNLKSRGVDKVSINFYSLYAGTATNVNTEASFNIKVDIKGNLSEGVLATKNQVVSSSKDSPFTVSVNMQNVADQDDYYIEIYIEAIKSDIGFGIVTDIEGNDYPYRKFGDAGYWMTQNLRSTKYADGTILISSDFIDSQDEVTAAYYYPNMDTNILSTHPEYGLLYTWMGATKSRKMGSNESNLPTQVQYQGICPDGWHLPSDYEWNELEKEMADNYTAYSEGASDVQPWDASWADTDNAYRGSHGDVMKSLTAVTRPTNGYSKSAVNGGFNVLLVSNIIEGISPNFGVNAHFWTSSTTRDSYALLRALSFNKSLGVYRNRSMLSTMRSVRCKKDE